MSPESKTATLSNGVVVSVQSGEVLSDALLQDKKIDRLKSHTTKAFLYQVAFAASATGVTLSSIFIKILSERDDNVKIEMGFTIAGLVISAMSMIYAFTGVDAHTELAKKEPLHALKSVYLAIKSMLSAAATVGLGFLSKTLAFLIKEGWATCEVTGPAECVPPNLTGYLVGIVVSVAVMFLGLFCAFYWAHKAEEQAALAPREDSDRLRFFFQKAYAVEYSALAFSGGFLINYLNKLIQDCHAGTNCKDNRYDVGYGFAIFFTFIVMIVMVFGGAAGANETADEIVAKSFSHAFKSLAAGTDAFISIGATAGLIYFALYLYSVIKADSCNNCSETVFAGLGIDASLLIMFFTIIVAAKQLAVANKEYIAAQPADQRESSMCSKARNVLTSKPSKALAGSAGVVGSVFLIKDVFMPLLISDESSRSIPLLIGAVFAGMGVMTCGAGALALSCHSIEPAFRAAHARCAMFSAQRMARVAETNSLGEIEREKGMENGL